MLESKIQLVGSQGSKPWKHSHITFTIKSKEQWISAHMLVFI